MSKVHPENEGKADFDSGAVASKAEDGKQKEAEGAQQEEEPPSVGCAALFRFADGLDIFLMIVGSLCAAAVGVSLPLMLLVFGDMTNAFITDQLLQSIYDSTNLAAENITLAQLQTNQTVKTYVANNFNISWDYLTTSLTSSSTESLLSQMTSFSYFYVGIGCGALVCSYLQQMCWLTAAERQTKRIRRKFFWAIMRQEIGWFDTHESGELNTRLSDDLNKIHDGIGSKIANFIQWFVGFVAGIVLGFVKGWKLTLVILSVSPLLVLAAILLNMVTTAFTARELQAYAKAGAIAEEVISGIRTVTAFGGQKKESKRYNSNLQEAANMGTKKAFSTGLSLGFVWFVFFCSYALGFWYGAKLVNDEPTTYNAGTILTVFFAVIMAAFSLGSAFPNLTDVAVARGAAYTIYGIIDQEPHIDASSDEGETIDKLQGNVEVRDVHFEYPARSDVPVLQGLSFKVDVGQTAALVGSSGCGKSTVVQLIQRFYDVGKGQVLIDGKDIRNLNVAWLRRQLGVVSQEPVLFATTIAENIKYGREGVTQEEIEQACRQSNAHDFITALPSGYDTVVGERGAQMSGGQKQRIAIARALVRDPKILLLDEATSALDTESEAVVQEALDKASQGRTTIVIAHRLSTIKTANVIMGIKEGQVSESGSHDQLMSAKGLYFNLVQNQSSQLAEEEDARAPKESNQDQDELKVLQKQLAAEADEEAMKKLKEALNRSGVEEVSAGEKDGEGAAGDSGAAAAEQAAKGPEAEAGMPSMQRLLSLNSQEAPYIVLGCIGALLNGGVQPAFAIVFSEIISVFATIDENKFKSQVALYSLIFVALGAFMFVTQFFQAYMFGKSGEALTMRLRKLCFQKILTFEIGWFDNEANATGSVCTRLATEASLVQGATGIRLGMMVMLVANLGTSIIIAFVFGWQLTLVILAFVPVMIISGFVEMQAITAAAGVNKQAYEEAGKISTEAIVNIRTVATLTKEPMFHKDYMEKLEPVYKSSLRKAHMDGIAYGLSQGVIFFAYAAAFQMGAYLISKDAMTFENVMRVFSAVIYGAMGAGNASAMAPDYGKAMIAASQIFAMLDRESHIDALSEDGTKPESAQGEVAAKDVRFRYPSRPDVAVLRGINLSAKRGQTLALVGSSGCGKSTVLQLLQRFYDPLLGEVTLDNSSTNQLNVGWLRSTIGSVSQEPTLFDTSIRENIAYGDCSREVPMDEVINAARNANIHSFIEGLPQGYDTNVGDKGTQLSGGQKQRIAIARALVRDPKILLLDEATSALDTESEKVVQEALDRAQKGRTCIVIAHRLSTIQNADLICVLHHGVVVEQGTHQSLLQAKGRYYTLQQKGQLKQQ